MGTLARNVEVERVQTVNLHLVEVPMSEVAERLPETEPDSAQRIAAVPPPPRRRGRILLPLFLSLVVAVVGLGFMPTKMGMVSYNFVGPQMPPPVPRLATSELKTLFPDLFPMQWPVQPVLKRGSFTIRTSINQRLQATMDAYLQARRPRYGAVAVINPLSGEVLCLSSYSTDSRFRDKNLALLNSFPAASVFKLVTAAGVLSEGKRGRLDQIDFVGSRTARPADWNMVTTVSRRSHWVTLEEAFAGSINPVFGKLGLYDLGPQGLLHWAEAFGWHRPVTEQLAVEPSQIDVSFDALAAAAAGSGYTQMTTMSPLHGAAIAAAVVNDGVLMQPVAVSSVTDEIGRTRYRRERLEGTRILTPEVAGELRKMMQATIEYGTAHRAFEDRDSSVGTLVIGGKTGTLTGNSPPGRAQWLVGFALDTVTGEPLAFAAVTVHGSSSGTDAKRISLELISAYYGQKGQDSTLLAMADAEGDEPSSDESSPDGVRSHRSQPFALLAGAAASADSDRFPQPTSSRTSRKASETSKSSSSTKSSARSKRTSTKAASSKTRSSRSSTRAKKRTRSSRATPGTTAKTTAKTTSARSPRSSSR